MQGYLKPQIEREEYLERGFIREKWGEWLPEREVYLTLGY